MAYDMRHGTKQRTPDLWVLDDLQKIESVVGSCFQGLGFLQRKATMLAIYIAAKCAAGAHPRFELAEDGWRLSPDCSEVSSSAARIEVAANSPATDLSQLIKVSYARDYNSQRARVALRSRKREAADQYFVDNDDEDSDVSPVLERFRERSRYQLIGV
ncbi:MAG TPA: hypothetical protein VGZ02_10515 [Candidatus Baltobacteraceae bacterium]|jgi:hypothetical protein|nr:hypothetical protein [Candidatus Baltobacteraceae bacterium]